MTTPQVYDYQMRRASRETSCYRCGWSILGGDSYVCCLHKGDTRTLKLPFNVHARCLNSFLKLAASRGVERDTSPHSPSTSRKEEITRLNEVYETGAEEMLKAIKGKGDKNG